MDMIKLLQSITRSDSRKYGVQWKIQLMDYQFYLGEIFHSPNNKERSFDLFVDYLSSFIIHYINKWLSEHKEDLEKNISAVYDFKSTTDFRKLFEAVYSGSNWSDQRILMPVSNAMLHLKRYGNGLALKLVSNNSSSEIHVDGTKILQGFSEEDNDSYPSLHEFIKSIECIIPLRKKQAESNSVMVDFHDLYDNLTTACPYLVWLSEKDFVNGVVGSAYIKPSDYSPGVLVGKSQNYGFPIIGELLHLDVPDSKKTPQWRKGNIEKEGDSCYVFADGDDLQLSLKVDFPFASNAFSEEVFDECDIQRMQYDLQEVGAMMYTQLCNMMRNPYYPFVR